jgi:hypothetical protein
VLPIQHGTAKNAQKAAVKRASAQNAQGVKRCKRARPTTINDLPPQMRVMLVAIAVHCALESAKNGERAAQRAEAERAAEHAAMFARYQGTPFEWTD